MSGYLQKYLSNSFIIAKIFIWQCYNISIAMLIYYITRFIAFVTHKILKLNSVTTYHKSQDSFSPSWLQVFIERVNSDFHCKKHYNRSQSHTVINIKKKKQKQRQKNFVSSNFFSTYRITSSFCKYAIKTIIIHTSNNRSSTNTFSSFWHSNPSARLFFTITIPTYHFCSK